MKKSLRHKAILILGLIPMIGVHTLVSSTMPKAQPIKRYKKTQEIKKIEVEEIATPESNESKDTEEKKLFTMSEEASIQVLCAFLLPWYGITMAENDTFLLQLPYKLFFGIPMNDQKMVSPYRNIIALIIEGIVLPHTIKKLLVSLLGTIRQHSWHKAFTSFLKEKFKIKDIGATVELVFVSLAAFAAGFGGASVGFPIYSIIEDENITNKGIGSTYLVALGLAGGTLAMLVVQLVIVLVGSIFSIPHIFIGKPLETVVNNVYLLLDRHVLNPPKSDPSKPPKKKWLSLLRNKFSQFRKTGK